VQGGACVSCGEGVGMNATDGVNPAKPCPPITWSDLLLANFPNLYTLPGRPRLNRDLDGSRYAAAAAIPHAHSFNAVFALFDQVKSSQVIQNPLDAGIEPF
jgi:hypothetical protein